MKIYFIGSLFRGSTSTHRLNALKKNISYTFCLDQDMVKNAVILLFDRFFKKFNLPTINSYLLNKRVITEFKEYKPDIVWIDKGLFLYPKTIKNLRLLNPESKVIHYSPDDMMNPDNQTALYLNALPLYDLHITTKSYNVNELYKLGAKEILFVNNAYAPEVHKPYELTYEEKEKYSADVSFIGGPEKERVESINTLANEGIKIVVWGNGWSKFLSNHTNIIVKKGWFPDEEYSKIICASKINLAFLRKINRDLQTTRTMEITACGGFMLAERTEEHVKLFIENEEAVYFSDQNELKSKIKYYLENESERKAIALNGLKRSKRSGYDNITMVNKVIDSL